MTFNVRASSFWLYYPLDETPSLLFYRITFVIRQKLLKSPQICRPRVPKRAHHISNLTTALTVLRRRGLELVNNNASDIADGNPRIILGLIWQIILHFQIETNVALLREWGWGSIDVQSSREHIHSRSLSSPMNSYTTSSISSVPSTSTDSPKISMRLMKSSIEQVMIRWINNEVAQRVNMRVENMDHDWKDGVMFNALVFRWKPDVIDMEKVRTVDAKTNLENAFEMASKHLGIKRLLEVEDVLQAKPDKRSIITYVSQFIRAFGKSPPVAEECDVHSEFVEWLSKAYRLDLVNNDHQAYFRILHEFVEYRCIFNTIMATKFNFTLEELSEIQTRWETLQRNLEAAASVVEKRLPKPYSSLSDWTAQGQSIISTPLNLPSENPQKCLAILQKMISDHNRHFVDLSAKMDELNTALEHDRVSGRSVAPEYVEPLRLRMKALAAEVPMKIATLKILYSYYRCLAYVDDLECKMELWRSPESLQLLDRWITEYDLVEIENPHMKCNNYIEMLKKELSSGTCVKVNGEGMVKKCCDRSEEVLKSFGSLKEELIKLRILWTEWENELKRLEAIAIEGGKMHVNTLKEETEAIRLLESKFDTLVPLLSVAARLYCNRRMEMIKENVKQLNKFAASSRLVKLIPSTSQSHHRGIHNVNTLEARIKEINNILKMQTVGCVENELQEKCKKMDLKRELTVLQNAKPRMCLIEHYLDELQKLLASKDANSYDRAQDVWNQLEREINALNSSEISHYVDCKNYEGLSSWCAAKIRGEVVNTFKISEEQPPVNKEYVKEVINRVELILARREANDDEIRASINDMADCETVLTGWSNKKLDGLRTLWNAKQIEFQLWQTYMERVRQIADILEQRRTCDSQTMDEIKRIEKICEQISLTDLNRPLRSAVNELRDRAERVLKERLDSLRMSGEEDCFVAHDIVQAYPNSHWINITKHLKTYDLMKIGEELVAFCPQLNERSIETRTTLFGKMELFRRLQNYYDTVKYLRNQNDTWNVTTLSEVPVILSELKRLLILCDSDLYNDGLQLRADLIAINGSFFQLEFDRVNEKSVAIPFF
ncbi:hypothetical protein DICVIV_00837 [Dictyocaulus viviparus]|uniref:Calponin-homology (CH) domain-containing protein n=1 Tax=Dictyocaulus viviparus TaxID=29172 RepID=A0A0D8Y7Y4_DICVI|nr:hypothetical protein DICVIV_00837 [Dictyocaulus viviparus]